MISWNGFNLSNRAVNSLHTGGIHTVAQVRALGHDRLMTLPYMTRRAAKEVWDAVAQPAVAPEVAAVCRKVRALAEVDGPSGMTVARADVLVLLDTVDRLAAAVERMERGGHG